MPVGTPLHCIGSRIDLSDALDIQHGAISNCLKVSMQVPLPVAFNCRNPHAFKGIASKSASAQQYVKVNLLLSLNVQHAFVNTSLSSVLLLNVKKTKPFTSDDKLTLRARVTLLLGCVPPLVWLCA